MATRKVRQAGADEPDSAPQAVDEIVSKVGEKLLKLRAAEGLSLQQLAQRSDVSAAAINKIEHSSMVPTITTLLKLSAALGVPVGHFVEEEAPDPEPVHFTSAGDRPEIYTSHRGLSLHGVTGSYGQFKTAAAVARVAAGATSGKKALKHVGEELVHVLSGEMVFRVGRQTFHLGVGDSLHFSGSLPHYWENPGKRPADLVWVALRNGT